MKQVGAPRSDKRPSAVSKRSAKAKPADRADKIEAKEQDAQREREEYSNQWTRSLPFVPSTQHLNPKDVYVASFFSTHRPISISGPLPPETSVEDIDKIFAPKPKSQRRAQDVIYTLASVVQNLDSQTDAQQVQPEEPGVAQRADIIKALTQQSPGAMNQDGNVQHLDGQPLQGQIRVGGNNVKIVIQRLANQFRPFNPPPAPTAAPEVEFFSREKDGADAAAAEESQARALEVEMISQDRDTQAEHQSSSQSTNTFFTPSFSPASSRRTRRGVLMVRDLQKIRDARLPGVERMRMYLISVRRQRKLKMKKHKYKKLQRKTRNLRRRQGKI